MKDYTLIDLEINKLIYFESEERLVSYIKDLLVGIADNDIQTILDDDLVVFRGKLDKINLSVKRKWDIIVEEK